MTDSDIIRLFFARDEQAIAETAERYGRYCMTIARDILDSEQDAEECISDVYLKVWTSIPPANEPHSAEWVFDYYQTFFRKSSQTPCKL